MNQYVKEKIPEIIALLPIGIMILDQSVNCIYANHTFERIAGLTPGQALGKGWLRYMVTPDLEKAIRSAAGKFIEVSFNHASVPIHARLTITEAEGLHCCTVEDITGQRQAALEEEAVIRQAARSRQKLMQQMLDCTDAILYSVNREGNITAFNQAAVKAIRLRKGVEVQIGDYWPDMVSGDSGLEKERMETLFRQVIAGGSYTGIEELRIGNGETISYSIQVGPIFDERRQITGAVLCAHNITVISRLQKEAADEARLRTSELERWNQFYDTLLSILAHDLRQPLAVIIMGADMVSYTKKELTVAELTGIMGNLRNTCKKSIELLQGLLYWVKSKKEDFSYTPSPLNLHELVHEANALFLHDQKKKNITLQNHVAEGQMLYAHHQMLLFVCRNLINNATKYAFPDSVIHVRTAVNDGSITLVVQDTGKGMSEDRLAGLFSFQDQETAVQGIRGAGMALTIARDMITQMNGHIWAESEPGNGTTFYVRLPGR